MAVRSIVITGELYQKDFVVMFTRMPSAWEAKVVTDGKYPVYQLDIESRPGPTVAERLVKHAFGRGKLRQGEHLARKRG